MCFHGQSTRACQAVPPCILPNRQNARAILKDDSVGMELATAAVKPMKELHQQNVTCVMVQIIWLLTVSLNERNQKTTVWSSGKTSRASGPES